MSEPKTEAQLPESAARSEARPHEDAELFRGIFDHSRTGIVVTDLEDRFLRCNPAYERMLGTSESTLRGMRVNDLVHPEDRAENEALLSQLTAGKINYFESVSRYVKPSGKILWVHKYASLSRDARGTPQGILKLITDITDIKNQELALAASEERFRTLTATLPAFVFVTDAEGGNLYVNPQFETFIGRRAHDMIGTDWLDIVHPQDRKQVVRAWQKSRRSGEMFDAEFRMRGADGEWRSFLNRSQPVRDRSGAIVQWVGTSTEIQQLVDIRDELAESRSMLEVVNDRLEIRVSERTAELREANRALLVETDKKESSPGGLVPKPKAGSAGAVDLRHSARLQQYSCCDQWRL